MVVALCLRLMGVARPILMGLHLISLGVLIVAMCLRDKPGSPS